MIRRHKAMEVQKPSRKSPPRSVLKSVLATKRFSVSRPARNELYEEGKRLRDKCPRQSHALWRVPEHRPDPLFLMKESSKGRIPKLIPIRYGRMMQSPFTFYRGAALNMAADLAG